MNFESTLVMATPTSPPSREGNSYDTNDIAMAGMTQLQMESRMKSQLRASTCAGRAQVRLRAIPHTQS